jgi:hypothetical protein
MTALDILDVQIATSAPSDSLVDLRDRLMRLEGHYAKHGHSIEVARWLASSVALLDRAVTIRARLDGALTEGDTP